MMFLEVNTSVVIIITILIEVYISVIIINNDSILALIVNYTSNNTSE
jgi:hypothetical protein